MLHQQQARTRPSVAAPAQATAHPAAPSQHQPAAASHKGHAPGPLASAAVLYPIHGHVCCVVRLANSHVLAHDSHGLDQSHTILLLKGLAQPMEPPKEEASSNTGPPALHSPGPPQASPSKSQSRSPGIWGTVKSLWSGNSHPVEVDEEESETGAGNSDYEDVPPEDITRAHSGLSDASGYTTPPDVAAQFYTPRDPALGEGSYLDGSEHDAAAVMAAEKQAETRVAGNLASAAAKASKLQSAGDVGVKRAQPVAGSDSVDLPAVTTAPVQPFSKFADSAVPEPSAPKTAAGEGGRAVHEQGPQALTAATGGAAKTGVLGGSKADAARAASMDSEISFAAGVGKAPGADRHSMDSDVISLQAGIAGGTQSASSAALEDDATSPLAAGPGASNAVEASGDSSFTLAKPTSATNTASAVKSAGAAAMPEASVASAMGIRDQASFTLPKPVATTGSSVAAAAPEGYTPLKNTGGQSEQAPAYTLTEAAADKAIDEQSEPLLSAGVRRTSSGSGKLMFASHPVPDGTADSQIATKSPSAIAEELKALSSGSSIDTAGSGAVGSPSSSSTAQDTLASHQPPIDSTNSAARVLEMESVTATRTHSGGLPLGDRTNAGTGTPPGSPVAGTLQTRNRSLLKAVEGAQLEEASTSSELKLVRPGTPEARISRNELARTPPVGAADKPTGAAAKSAGAASAEQPSQSTAAWLGEKAAQAGTAVQDTAASLAAGTAGLAIAAKDKVGTAQTSQGAEGLRPVTEEGQTSGSSTGHDSGSSLAADTAGPAVAAKDKVVGTAGTSEAAEGLRPVTEEGLTGVPSVQDTAATGTASLTGAARDKVAGGAPAIRPAEQEGLGSTTSRAAGSGPDAAPAAQQSTAGWFSPLSRGLHSPKSLPSPTLAAATAPTPVLSPLTSRLVAPVQDLEREVSRNYHQSTAPVLSPMSAGLAARKQAHLAIASPTASQLASPTSTTVAASQFSPLTKSLSNVKERALAGPNFADERVDQSDVHPLTSYLSKGKERNFAAERRDNHDVVYERPSSPARLAGSSEARSTLSSEEAAVEPSAMRTSHVGVPVAAAAAVFSPLAKGPVAVGLTPLSSHLSGKANFAHERLDNQDVQYEETSSPAVPEHPGATYPKYIIPPSEVPVGYENAAITHPASAATLAAASSPQTRSLGSPEPAGSSSYTSGSSWTGSPAQDNTAFSPLGSGIRSMLPQQSANVTPYETPYESPAKSVQAEPAVSDSLEQPGSHAQGLYYDTTTALSKEPLPEAAPGYDGIGISETAGLSEAAAERAGKLKPSADLEAGTPAEGFGRVSVAGDRGPSLGDSQPDSAILDEKLDEVQPAAAAAPAAATKAGSDKLDDIDLTPGIDANLGASGGHPGLSTAADIKHASAIAADTGLGVKQPKVAVPVPKEHARSSPAVAPDAPPPAPHWESPAAVFEAGLGEGGPKSMDTAAFQGNADASGLAANNPAAQRAGEADSSKSAADEKHEGANNKSVLSWGLGALGAAGAALGITAASSAAKDQADAPGKGFQADSSAVQLPLSESLKEGISDAATVDHAAQGGDEADSFEDAVPVSASNKDLASAADVSTEPVTAANEAIASAADALKAVAAGKEQEATALAASLPAAAEVLPSVPGAASTVQASQTVIAAVDHSSAAVKAAAAAKGVPEPVIESVVDKAAANLKAGATAARQSAGVPLTEEEGLSYYDKYIDKAVDRSTARQSKNASKEALKTTAAGAGTPASSTSAKPAADVASSSTAAAEPGSLQAQAEKPAAGPARQAQEKAPAAPEPSLVAAEEVPVKPEAAAASEAPARAAQPKGSKINEAADSKADGGVAAEQRLGAATAMDTTVANGMKPEPQARPAPPADAARGGGCFACFRPKTAK
ncbi:hypothetical protein WJX72_010062 [[Myrmecia] bisecta]|uniref:Proteophosphoglycan ppg4 n=1 Tax=[Myrmecia] bisecta TaxID=41462 RepID=A0AAW1R8P2_9CHLO